MPRAIAPVNPRKRGSRTRPPRAEKFQWQAWCVLRMADILLKPYMIRFAGHHVLFLVGAGIECTRGECVDYPLFQVRDVSFVAGKGILVGRRDSWFALTLLFRFWGDLTGYGLISLRCAWEIIVEDAQFLESRLRQVQSIYVVVDT